VCVFIYICVYTYVDTEGFGLAQADISLVGSTPSWLTIKQESSPERLTGCGHPNFPPRTTRATSVPLGIRTLDLLLARRDLRPLD